MNKNLESFLQTIQGTWILQKTTYYIHNQSLEIYTSENTISIQKKLDNICEEQISQYYYVKNTDINKNEERSQILIVNQQDIRLKIINDKINYNGTLNLYSDKYINKIFIYKNICYSEFNYPITPKFLLSIGVIKKNNRYIAVTFASYIKKIID